MAENQANENITPFSKYGTGKARQAHLYPDFHRHEKPRLLFLLSVLMTI